MLYICTMFRVILLWLMIISGVVMAPAQRNPETPQLLDKAYESLYENPDQAFQILQNINLSKELEPIRQRVQVILSRAYNFKGEYAKSIDQSLDKLSRNNNPYSDYALAQQYQALRLYKQSARISRTLSENISKIKSQTYPENLVAYIYQLNASNLMVDRQWKKALENLDLSNAQLKNTEEDFIISIENDIYRTFILMNQHYIDRAELLVEAIQKKLEKRPQYVFLSAFNLDNYGRILFLKKDYMQSVDKLNKALGLIQNKPYNALRYRIDEDLSKNYLALKNEDLYQKYYSVYKEQTDQLDKSRKDALRNLVKLNEQYENQRLEESDQKMVRKISRASVASLCAILTIALLTFAEQRKNQSLQKKIDFYTRQQGFITSTIKPEITSLETTKKPLSISKEKETDILARLEDFEKSEKFLNRDMSLAVLAGLLETNTKYLSEIIKKYKQKNYNHYINELRINYIAYLLKTDPAYLNYKVSYLAEKAGFSSHSAFTTVFKSVTGMSPNTYIQQLNQNPS